MAQVFTVFAKVAGAIATMLSVALMFLGMAVFPEFGPWQKLSFMICSAWVGAASIYAISSIGK